MNVVPFDPGPYRGRQIDPRLFDPSLDQQRMDEITDMHRKSRYGLDSITYRVQGIPMLLYKIGDLARMLGRQSVTMRKWEQLGYLPETPFKVPHPSKGELRLYSEPMIMGTVAIAREEKILIQYSPEATNIARTKFRPKVEALFIRLADPTANFPKAA